MPLQLFTQFPSSVVVDHLEEITVEQLQDALDDVTGKTPAKRLLAAIAYKHGISQTELAEWYGVQRRTIYGWLQRLDTDEPLGEAVTDAKRSGRNRKLSASQQREFEATVQAPPAAVGLDASAWTPALAREFLADAYGVEYSIPSCRRLLKEAGLRYRRPDHTADGEDGAQSETGGDSNGKRWVPE